MQAEPPSNLRVLVTGGTGFIGRHAVAALRAADARVTIGSRQPAADPSASNWCQVRLEQLLTPADWDAVIEGFDVVLNCVGILRARGAETYERVHHLAPRAMAEACRARGIRFIQVSALGLHDEARSGFLTSKLNGERAIQRIGGDWVIARPSLLDGVGGYGAAWLRGVARLPVFVAPADARGRFAALDVEELGEALARLALGSADALKLGRSREFELGGPYGWTFAQYLHGLRARHGSGRALCLTIPGIVARLGAHICDLLHFTPFSFGHWELLRRDNLPQPNRLPELLGRDPRVVAPPPEDSAGGH